MGIETPADAMARARAATAAGPSASPALVAVAYGAMHAAVDAASVTTVFAAGAIHELPSEAVFALVLAYDLGAFASQALLGFLVDLFRSPRGAAALGILVTGIGAAWLPVEPISATVLAALGNALFHAGAGAISLALEPGRARLPGVFIGPGALGLGLGMYLGRLPVVPIGWLLGALGACLGLALAIRRPLAPAPRAADEAPLPRAGGLGAAAAVLLLLAIVLRSTVGLAGSHACPKEALLAVGLPLAGFGGKALGGFLADRLGWIETAVGALLLSAPLLAFAGGDTGLAIAGLFLFQMTTPVTLVGVALVLPRRPGLAFGLTALALAVGSVPTFLEGARAYYRPAFFLAAILLSAAAVFGALRALGVRPFAGRWRPGPPDRSRVGARQSA